MNFKPVHALVAGMAIAVVVVWIASRKPGRGRRHRATAALVAEDASAPLARIAIEYAPGWDAKALPIYRALLAALPERVQVDVEVAQDADFARFEQAIGPSPRFHPVVVGKAISTWARDRFAARTDGSIVAPPAIPVVNPERAADWFAPFAIARDQGRDADVAPFVFEGGDLAATPSLIFADANLRGRNIGRADASTTTLKEELGERFRQRLVWLGREPGDVPRHHIMMYLMPVDDHTVLVGDLHAGLALLPPDAGLPLDTDPDADARRFDEAATELAAAGFDVIRIPVVVLEGAGSYVTYTNALFDRDADGRKVVYLPTYRLPPLDDAARKIYESLGFVVRPVDVSTIFEMNGSLGCLVNVLARG